MLVRKVTQHAARGKTRKVPTGVSAEYNHHIALDWSLKIMAIAHRSRRDRMSKHEHLPVREAESFSLVEDPAAFQRGHSFL